MTKLGVLSTHVKLLRSKSPLQPWCVVNSLRLDKHVRVAVNAKSQRCLLGRHTSAVAEIFFEPSADATAASFSEGELTAVGTPQ